VDFYSTLIQPLDPKYYHDAAFFLCTGEQAPFSGFSEVLELEREELLYWVNKLSELYKKQKEEMEKMKSRKR
jgi:hypothetical protein